MSLNKRKSNDHQMAEMVKQESKEEKDKSNGYNEDSITTTQNVNFKNEKHMTDAMKAKADQKAKIEYYKLMLLVWISRAIPIGAGIACFIYMIYLLANPDNWKTNADAADTDILSRESNRGLFVSVVIAILLNIIGAFMFAMKVKEALVVTNYGFILGPVIGYMMDQGIGRDEGFKDFMTSAGFSYTFSSLIDGNFLRYIITIFLDLFISNPLQDVLKTQAIALGVIQVLRDETGKTNKYQIKYDNFVAMNYPSILQSIVAFVTFQAYTNQTRFAWAYPSESLDREYRIPPGTIMLSTAIAGVLYLNFYTIMDYISDREYFDVNTKLLYVLVILLILCGLNQTNTIEAPVEGEPDENYTKSIESFKPYLGMMFFAAFVLYGFVYPLWTVLGCCGYCRPDPEEIEKEDSRFEL